jgi:adenylyltransferase/sulfurtransferase
VNGVIRIEGVVADLNAGNVEELIGDCDLVMDGTDNFEARYIVNDACVKLGKPWVYTGAVSTYGMLLLVRPGETPCLRCAFPDPPPAGASDTCDTAGVLGPAVSVIASYAATEGLKWLCGAHEAVLSELLHVDVWELTWHRFRIPRKDDCPCCVRREFPFLEPASGTYATSLCGRNAVQINLSRPTKLDLPQLAARLRPLGEVSVNPFLLKAQVGDHLLTVFGDGRAIIQGTTDEPLARSLYARYIGT